VAPDENTRRLVEAIVDARLMPIPEAEELDPCATDGQRQA
jgi:hypothetical protein